MRLMPRLFVGGYREIRRPVHMADESLMRRIEEARRELRLQGKEVKPLRGSAGSRRRQLPAAEHASG